MRETACHGFGVLKDMGSEMLVSYFYLSLPCLSWRRSPIRFTDHQTEELLKEGEKKGLEIEKGQGSLITVDCNRFFSFLSQPALMSRKLLNLSTREKKRGSIYSGVLDVILLCLVKQWSGSQGDCEMWIFRFISQPLWWPGSYADFVARKRFFFLSDDLSSGKSEIHPSNRLWFVYFIPSYHSHIWRVGFSVWSSMRTFSD